MSELTRKAMGRIRRKLSRWEDLSSRACGHEAGLMKALRARLEAESEIEREFERLEGEIAKWQDRGLG